VNHTREKNRDPGFKAGQVHVFGPHQTANEHSQYSKLTIIYVKADESSFKADKTALVSLNRCAEPLDGQAHLDVASWRLLLRHLKVP